MVQNAPLHHTPKEVGVDRFDRAIPGQSLTDEPGGHTWERPPKFPDVDDAYEYVVRQLETPATHKRMIKMMYSGVPIEALTDVITFAGFTEGMWTPDVAEMMKPFLAVKLISYANKAGIVPRVYAKDPDKKELENDDSAKVMKMLRPEQYNKIVGKEEGAEVPESVDQETTEEIKGFMAKPSMDMEE